jgi:hypothetical protein
MYWFNRRHNKSTKQFAHTFIVLIVRLFGLKYQFCYTFRRFMKASSGDTFQKLKLFS